MATIAEISSYWVASLYKDSNALKQIQRKRSLLICRASNTATQQHAKKTKWVDWKNAWYPVAIEKHLNKRVPHAVTILGYDLVIWWDKNGKNWQVFDDKCPHRLAPLSEGRIDENGHLQCSYHGWTFAPCTGSCSGIPQARPQDNKLVSSPKACAAVYSSIEQQGILWFCIDKPSECQPPFFPVLQDSSFLYYWATSDLPYGYEALIENLMDPTHVPFAHHKLQGNRKNAKPVDFTVSHFDRDGFRGSTGRGDVIFMPPCSFMMEILVSEDKKVYTLFMCVPVAAGKSKVFWSFPRNFAKWPVPMWISHLGNMLVLDSDLYLLHLTEKKQRVDETCYCPTSADAFVLAFRRWLSSYAGNAPSYAPHINNSSLPESPPKRQLMDRYENHVKKCPVCMGALRVFKAVELALQVATIGLVAAAAARYRIQLVLAAIVAWLASRWTSYFIDKNYHFHDYNHALIK